MRDAALDRPDPDAVRARIHAPEVGEVGQTFTFALHSLRQAEDAGHVVFGPLGGSNLDLWVPRLEGFNRPEFYLMDRDTTPPAEPHYKNLADEMNQRDNCTAWHTGKRELENYIHPDVIKSAYPQYAGTGDDFENTPNFFAQAVHEASESGVLWAEVITDREKLGKRVYNAKRRLNSEFVAKMTPELLTSIDTRNEVRGWLRAIGSVLASNETSGQEERE